MTLSVDDIIHNTENVCTDTHLFMTNSGKIKYRINDTIYSIGEYMSGGDNDIPPPPMFRPAAEFYKFSREYWKDRDSSGTPSEKLTKDHSDAWISALFKNKGHMFTPPRPLYSP